MKLKKMLLVSTCALTLGTVSTMGSSLVQSNTTTVYAQDQQSDSTLSQEEQDTLVIIKDNLAGVQPINLEQLLEVDDHYLIDLYNTEQADTSSIDDVWRRIYQQITVDYPQLNLLTGEDYDTYNEIANLIANNSQYSYSDLNTALPSDILSWYNSYITENEVDALTTIEAILPNITSAREAYIERREQRESDEGGQEETPNPEEDAFKTAVLEMTDITEEQLNQFTADELGPIEQTAANGEYGQEAMDTVRSQIIQLNPDVFTEEQVDSVAEDIHSALIESTPITQEQFDQLDTNELVALIGEGNRQSADIAWAFNRLVENYPAVFESEVNRFRTALIDEQNLNSDELLAVSASDLLWAEYQVFMNNNQTENIEALALFMQENFGVSVNDDQTSSEETPEKDNQFEQAIAEFTDITEDQLDQFTTDELEPIKLTATNGDYSQEVMNTVRSQIIQLNPEVFTSDQVNSVAEDIHSALISSTPITQEQLNQLDNNELVALVGEGNRQGYDIGWTFNSLIENYPTIFESELNRFRTALIEDYSLNEDELLAVSATDLLWAEYQVFMDNKQAEDMEALAITMQEEYGVTIDGDGSTSSSEEESDESDEDLSDLDRYLETLVNQTDLTVEQLSNFSDEHIQILMNRLNLTTESTSDKNLQALRDEIVISSYENFDSNQLAQAIEPLRQTVINQTPITESILNEVSSETLANLYNEAKNNNYDVPYYIFQQLLTNQSDLFNDLVLEAKNQITQNTTITQEQVDKMQLIDILLAVQPNEAGEVNYVDVTNYLAEKYRNIIGNDGEQSQSSDQGSSKVNVSISSSVEEKDSFLPNTGESNSILIIILGAVALVGGGLYLVLSGRNKSKH
ncbi:LPXTG cell wall anchor domain-containing protein [Aerococcaceae bacterium WGS1372]